MSSLETNWQGRPDFCNSKPVLILLSSNGLMKEISSRLREPLKRELNSKQIETIVSLLISLVKRDVHLKFQVNALLNAINWRRFQKFDP